MGNREITVALLVGILGPASAVAIQVFGNVLPGYDRPVLVVATVVSAVCILGLILMYFVGKPARRAVDHNNGGAKLPRMEIAGAEVFDIGKVVDRTDRQFLKAGNIRNFRIGEADFGGQSHDDN